jgi:hypothetical protein
MANVANEKVTKVTEILKERKHEEIEKILA